MKQVFSIMLTVCILGTATFAIVVTSKMAAVDPIDPLAPKYTAVVGPPPMTPRS